MRNKTTKKPKQAWTFLKQLALTNNQMPVADIDKLKKVKQEVSGNLKKLFALEDDPIEYVSGDNIYRAKFVIRANSSFATQSKRQKTAVA